jgi:hypothetical protein
MDTWTLPAKLFYGVMDTFIGALVLPCVTLTEFEDTLIEKSGIGGGG